MTSIWKRSQRRLRAVATKFLATKTIAMRNQQGIVSFTFDDFPSSAVTRGAKILQNFGSYGTFYAAGSISGRVVDDDRLFDSSEIAALAAVGHEIGCHTFSHLPISSFTKRALEEDLEKNAKFVANEIPGYMMSSFSYPFGDVSPFYKPLLQRNFATCRSTMHGLNLHRVDLGFLRAVRLYSNLIDEAIVSKLIDDAVEKAAWLIFYTHDVDDAPSCYGCTPSLLEYAVKLAASKAQILTIKNALAAIRFGDESR